MGVRAKNALIFADTDNGGIIHIANIKGGVGKSTVATNLAASLSKRGPTLIIDLDVQGSATVALGHKSENPVQSSWELFRRRFSSGQNSRAESLFLKVRDVLHIKNNELIDKAFKVASITSLVTNIQPGLDLIPANSDLFKTPSRLQLENLVTNLYSCRDYYKYIILDTPSVWNSLTRYLYLHSDLNLIPVTLNALSTKSLRDYLSNVSRLSERNPALRIRIIKNEVFGNQESKLKGKTRTMSENRKFLENLCEQVSFEGSSGISLLPQSIMFDLEIPESAIVRDAQDEGIPLQSFKKNAAVTKAFDELAKRVQYVLNTPVPSVRNRKLAFFEAVPKFCAAAALVVIYGLNPRVDESIAPRPVAPQQLSISKDKIYTHRFSQGESIYKLAKFAICHFRAVVPSFEEINQYVLEVVSTHNLTRLEGETKIKIPDRIPDGLEVDFYPPQKITNPEEKQLLPVYSFFKSMIGDSLAYITGDWCERGTGGGQPHYGLDVAAQYGSEIISPIDGEARLLTNEVAGRTVGVIADGMVIFFAHMDRRYVKNGTRVKKGQVLGTVGMTGRTSGPHVHIGYGIHTETGSDVSFGGRKFRVTDPKLFFYRQMFVDKLRANAS
ncbi:MAG: AAA family ATPase [Fibrobacter sp.]|jgi:cellulose biosynthesis protein BcsQ|nr:AAA family ATPase [Fibrobacter sp.]